MSLSQRDLNHLRKGVIKASWAAGKVLMKHFGKRLKIDEKKNAGLVTNADFEAEEAAFKVLRRFRPDFSFLAEESAPIAAPAEGRWILDPLDGTTNFIHGFPMFCVSIAAEWQGAVVAGAIFHPVFKETYWAARGMGAWVNKKKLAVSTTSVIRDTLLTTGFTTRREEWLHKEMEAFERLSGVVRAIRRPGSAALDLAYTARGVFDGFWERRLAPWDVAAGGLLVLEAGGRVTNFKGEPFQVDHKEILAGGPGIHRTLLQTIAPDLCLI